MRGELPRPAPRLLERCCGQKSVQNSKLLSSAQITSREAPNGIARTRIYRGLYQPLGIRTKGSRPKNPQARAFDSSHSANKNQLATQPTQSLAVTHPGADPPLTPIDARRD